ncbi:MAG: penicillin-binding protein 2 [Bifidobacteriaceae bacterium]|nr:penicillin-binding protein 2 [Bifidobacteriaceae bacterium]
MNKQFRKLSALILAMFVVLFGFATYLQFFDVPALRANKYNVRELYENLGKPRGAIIVGDKSVAFSEKSNDLYTYQRKYSEPDLYSTITGYFSVVTPAEKGIEAALNEELNGDSDAQWFSRFQNLLKDAPSGGSVVTTIDPDVQKAAYDALGNRKGAAIAIEPSTGKILAMVSKPTYDPNLLATHSEKEAAENYQKFAQGAGSSPLYNKTLAGLYAPGSIFKIITSSAAIESGKFNSNTEVDAPNSYTLPGTSVEIYNANNKSCSGTGKQSLSDALKVSCNTAFAKIGVELGATALINQAKAFGFGSEILVAGDSDTRAPMKAISSDLLTESRSPDKVALASFGQGEDLITPLQAAMLSAGIANGGTVMQPYLVDKVLDSDANEVMRTSPSVFSQAVSKETANQVRDMMVSVSDANGTAPSMRINGIDVAVKTGTAEANVQGTLNFWVTAFAPAADPKIAVAVFLEDANPLSNPDAEIVSVAREMFLARLK